MIGWVSGLLGWAIGGLDDLWKKAVAVFTAIVNWTTGLINQAYDDINAVSQWAWNNIQIVEKWAASMYTAITSWATSIFQSIVAWTSNLIDDIYKTITAIETWVGSWIDKIYSDVTGWIGQLEKWVISNIWDPLYNTLAGIYRWVTTYGYWMFYLLSHPDALATLLGQYLLAAWMGLSRKFAGPLGRWMLHSLLSMSNDIAGALEDFIAGIL